MKRLFPIALLLIICVLTIVTVVSQLSHLPSDYLTTRQAARHKAVLNGTANTPLIYRQTSELAILFYSKLFTYTPDIKSLFTSARLIQQFFLLLIAYFAYRQMRLKRWASVLGLTLLTICTLSAWRDSGMAFNTYTEVILMLTAMLVWHSRHYWWLIPLSVFAAFNREVYGCLLLGLIWMHWRGADLKRQEVLIASIVGFAAATVFLRTFLFTGMPPQPLYVRGVWTCLTWNLSDKLFWAALAGTVLPVIVGARFSPKVAAATVLVPLLMLIALGHAQETRVILPGLSVSLVPGAAKWLTSFRR